MIFIQSIQIGARGSCNPIAPMVSLITKRSIQNWPEHKANIDAYMPPKLEDRLLPQLPYTPTNWPKGVIPPLKHPRHDIDMRGPERIHNQLIYRQYGIIALGGGALRGPHYDIIRERINKWMDTERFFAVWRIDPPWKAVSQMSLGKKRGGGKAKVHHYEFPVRAGRVLVEVAGRGEYGEVEELLKHICKKMPIYVMPVSQEIIDNIRDEKLALDAANCNPFNYRYLVKNNFSDSQRFVTPKDMIWGGSYV